MPITFPLRKPLAGLNAPPEEIEAPELTLEQPAPAPTPETFAPQPLEMQGQPEQFAPAPDDDELERQAIAEGEKNTEEAAILEGRMNTAHEITQQGHKAVQWALQNPDQEDVALEAYIQQEDRTFGDKMGDVLKTLTTPETYGEAVKSVGKFFGGLIATPLHGISQVGLRQAAASWRDLNASGVLPSWADKFQDWLDSEEQTQGAESMLAAQHVEEANRGTAEAIYRGGDKLSQSLFGASGARRREMLADHFRMKLDAAKRLKQLGEGQPLDTGAVAGAFQAATDLSPQEAYGKEALAAQGAREASPLAGEVMGSAGDPQMLAMTVAGSVPGARKVAGAGAALVGGTMEAPMAIVKKGVELLNKTKAARPVEYGAAAAVAGAIIHNPLTAAKAAPWLLAGEAVGRAGRHLRREGVAAMTGNVSQTTKEITQALIDANKAGTSPLLAAPLKRIGRAGANLGINAGALATGMVPYSVLTTEGDPETFANAEVGAGVFGLAAGPFGLKKQMRALDQQAVRERIIAEGAKAPFTDTSKEGQQEAAFHVEQMSRPDVPQTLKDLINALRGRSQGQLVNGRQVEHILLPGDAFQQKAQGADAEGVFIGKDGKVFINADHAKAGEAMHEATHVEDTLRRLAYDTDVSQLALDIHGGLFDKHGKPNANFQTFIDTYKTRAEADGIPREWLDAQTYEYFVNEFSANTGRLILEGEDITSFHLPKPIEERVLQGVNNWLRNRGLDRGVGWNAKEVKRITSGWRDVFYNSGRAQEILRDVRQLTAQIKTLPKGSQQARDLVAQREALLDKVPKVLWNRAASVDAWKSQVPEDYGQQPPPEAPPTLTERPPGSKPPPPLSGPIIPPISVPAPIVPPQPPPPSVPPKDETPPPSNEPVPAGSAPADQGPAVAVAPPPPVEAPQTPPAGPAPAAPAPAPLKPALDFADIANQAEAIVRATSRHRVDKATGESPGLDKAVAAARFNAVVDAHAATENPDTYDGIMLRKNRFGKRSVSGKIVEGRHFDDWILAQADLTPEQYQAMMRIQEMSGTTVGLDYGHAPAGREEGIYAATRKAAQAKSSAADRASGESPTQEERKTFIPFNWKFNEGTRSFTVFGLSPEKLLNNFQYLSETVEHLGANNPYAIRDAEGDITGYNYKQLVADIKQGSRNHDNGWTFRGDKKIQGSLTDTAKMTSTPIEATPGYDPVKSGGFLIPEDRFNFLNMLLGEEGAKSTRGRKDKATGEMVQEPTREANEKLNLAIENDTLKTDEGETNTLREQINRAMGPQELVDENGQPLVDKDGNPTGQTASWSKVFMEQPLAETLRLDLINPQTIKPATRGDVSIRPHGYEGDLNRVFSKDPVTGRVLSPDPTYSAAGFSPEGGETTASDKRREGYTEAFRAMRGEKPWTDKESGLVFLSEDKANADQFKTEGRDTRGVRVKSDNLFDFRDETQRNKLREHLKNLGMDKWNAELKEVTGSDHEWEFGDIEHGLQYGLYQTLEMPSVVKWIKDQGYDGFRLMENERTLPAKTNIALFDPAHVQTGSKSGVYSPKGGETEPELAQETVPGRELFPSPLHTADFPTKMEFQERMQKTLLESDPGKRVAELFGVQPESAGFGIGSYVEHGILDNNPMSVIHIKGVEAPKGGLIPDEDVARLDGYAAALGAATRQNAQAWSHVIEASLADPGNYRYHSVFVMPEPARRLTLPETNKVITELAKKLGIGVGDVALINDSIGARILNFGEDHPAFHEAVKSVISDLFPASVIDTANQGSLLEAPDYAAKIQSGLGPQSATGSPSIFAPARDLSTAAADVFRQFHKDKGWPDPDIPDLLKGAAFSPKGGETEATRQPELFEEAEAVGLPKGVDVREARKLWREKGVDSPYFRKWFGDSKALDEDGRPLIVHHGTTQEFEWFDRDKAFPGSDMGPGFYFTTEPFDVQRNYASVHSPDLQYRIEARAEELWAYGSVSEELAHKIAARELKGGNEIVHDMYLHAENPVVLDGNRGTRFTMEIDENGQESGSATKLYEAVMDIADKYRVDGQEIWGSMTESPYTRRRGAFSDKYSNLAEDGYISAEQAIDSFKSSPEWENANDMHDATKAVPELLQALGFDSIHIKNSENRYSNMHMPGGTDHWIVFKPDQVKSVKNIGTFQTGEKRYNYSPAGGEVDPMGFYSKAQREAENIPQERGTGQQMLAMLLPKIKAEEADWMGLKEEFGDKVSVSKKELVDFIKANRLQLRETVRTGFSGDPRERLGGAPKEVSLEEAAKEYGMEPDDIGVEGSTILIYPSGVYISKLPDGNYHCIVDRSEIMDPNLSVVESYLAKEMEPAPKGAAVFDRPDLMTPGGTNYKEKLLQLPTEPRPEVGRHEYVIRQEIESILGDRRAADLLRRRYGGAELTPEENARADRAEERLNNRSDLLFEYQDSLGPKGQMAALDKWRRSPGQWKGGHWSDPGVVAHTREQDFMDTSGSKVRLVDEFQSDMHKIGREHGYQVTVSEEQINAADQALREATDKMTSGPRTGKEAQENSDNYRKARDEVNRLSMIQDGSTGAPDAPFKKSWSELLFKKALRSAVEDGMDKLAWVTGEMTSDRYDLSRHVNRIVYTDMGGKKNVDIYMKKGEDIGIEVDPDGKVVSGHGSFSGKGLDEIIGKDVAAKILNNEGKMIGGHMLYGKPMRELENLDLKINAKWAENLYDKSIPDFARKYVKKWGGEVGETTIRPLEVVKLAEDDYALREPGEEHAHSKFGYYSSKADAEAAAIEKGLRVHSIGITPQMRESVMQGQPLFAPKGGETEGEKLLTSGKLKFRPPQQAAIRRVVEENHPEAVLPRFSDSGRVRAQPWGFRDSPLAEQAAKGRKGAARHSAATDAYADALVREYNEAIQDPDIEAGRHWYATARTMIKELFGDDAQLFSELLAATSAITNVLDNYRNAVEAYQRHKAGDYDDIVSKYEGLEERLKNKEELFFDEDFSYENEEGEVKTIPKGTKVTRKKYRAYLDANGLLPKKASGAKYGVNSQPVLNVLARVWRQKVKGLKTPQFADNLSGASLEATIDSWAARTMRRVGYKGFEDRWRILPKAEQGVTARDFRYAQEAFRKAANQLGVNPDDLQAILWFNEKLKWDAEGWTGKAGAELSDFRSLLKETSKEDGKIIYKGRKKGGE